MDPITFLVAPIAWLFGQSPLTVFTALVVLAGGCSFAFMVRQ